MTDSLITRIAAGQGEDAEVRPAWFPYAELIGDAISARGKHRKLRRKLSPRIAAILRTKENPDG